MRKDK